MKAVLWHVLLSLSFLRPLFLFFACLKFLVWGSERLYTLAVPTGGNCGVLAGWLTFASSDLVPSITGRLLSSLSFWLPVEAPFKNRSFLAVHLVVSDGGSRFLCCLCRGTGLDQVLL